MPTAATSSTPRPSATWPGDIHSWSRCAAVNVDPETAARDLDIPASLMRRLGHTECGSGIYAVPNCSRSWFRLG